MPERSLFIVLEGLDGSGKTSVGRRLLNMLDAAYPGRIKLTFEPHDPSCAGLFIRQVLMKRIERYAPRVLALAFAANRLDHCYRVINPWLDGDPPGMVICDRYYLSSLVYQSSDDFPFKSVIELNEKARKPDLIFFLNVSNEVCYERLKIRNQPEELFEKDISETRDKFYRAIEFLRTHHSDYIVEIDGSGEISEVANKILDEIYHYAPDWRPKQPVISDELVPKNTSTFDKQDYTLTDVVNELEIIKSLSSRPLLEDDHDTIIAEIEKEVSAKIDSYTYGDLGSLFLSLIDSLGISVGKKLPWIHHDAYALEYRMPADILLRGAALLLPEPQRYDVIMKIAPELYQMSDFLLVFCPGPSEVVTKYYERDKIKYNTDGGEEGLVPSTQFITQDDIAKAMISSAISKIIEMRKTQGMNSSKFINYLSKYKD